MEKKKEPQENKALIIASSLLHIMFGIFAGIGIATLDFKYICIAICPVIGIGILRRVLKLKYYTYRSYMPNK